MPQKQINICTCYCVTSITSALLLVIYCLKADILNFTFTYYSFIIALSATDPLRTPNSNMYGICVQSIYELQALS